MKTYEQAKRYRDSARESGRCTGCLARPASTGFRKCEHCRASIQRSKSKFRGDKTRCYRCSCFLPSDHPWRCCSVCKEKDALYLRRRREELKTIVLTAYGNLCVCCGEAEAAFLTLDHINNDGALRRKLGEGKGEHIYNFLIRNHFPPDFQLLCRNCNWAKYSLGRCPHRIQVYPC